MVVAGFDLPPSSRADPLFRFEGAICRVWRQHSLSLLENSIASTSIFVLQATKSQRWMPWRLKPKKDVGGCDKPRGAAYQALIRGCPNGETHRSITAVLRSEHIGPVEGTGGIETSQYPEEKKATATP